MKRLFQVTILVIGVLTCSQAYGNWGINKLVIIQISQ